MDTITLILPSGSRYTLGPGQFSFPQDAIIKALGTGERWITVHPNGHDEKGVPVMIRETTHGSGVFHVVGGAGGKLNYLKLKGVKSVAEYRQEVAAGRKAKSEAKKQQTARDKELGIHGQKQALKDNVSAQRTEAEKAYIKTVAEAMGWQGHEHDPTPYLNLSEAAQAKAAASHHREWMKKAAEAVEAQRQQLLHDADLRAEALGEVPLDTPDSETISTQDLDPVAPPSGTGFAPNYKEAAEKRGLTAEALQEEKAVIVETLPEGARDTAAKRRATAEKISKEMDEVRDPGPLGADVKLLEGKQAAALVRAEKVLKAVQAQARKANQDIDKATEPKGVYVLEVSDADVDARVKADLEQDLASLATRGFLSEVGKQAGDGYEQGLGRHIGVGAYNAVNALALTAGGTGIMDRQAVDVLGVAGAAQVLARRLANSLTGDEMADLRAGLEDYHVEHYMNATEVAMKEVMQWRDVAAGIELEAADNGHDLARMRELNRKRVDAIDHANRILGTTLGEMEANAALVMALRQGAKDKIEVSLGEIPIEDAIRQARAIGLERGDYQINSVGSTRFLTVTGAGMDRIARPVDRDGLAQVRDNLSIMDGHHDEDGWLPQGIANRPDLAMQAQPGVAQRLARPFSPGDDLQASLRDYIGGRTADGDAPADIVADLLSQDMVYQAGPDKAGYLAALDAVAPMRGEDGKMRRAEDHQAAFEHLADDYVAALGGKAQPLHRQTFETDQHAVEALHRALSDEPAGVLAYQPVGDLTAKGQRALRDWWWAEVGKKDEKAAGLRQELAQHEANEPEKESQDMFGEMSVNPAWQSWKQQRDAKAEELNAAGLSWDKYQKVMGSPAKAYAAVQDLVRGRVAQGFHTAHNILNPGSPLKLGRTVIAGNLNHLDVVDPEARERRIEAQRQLVDGLRERAQGRYAAGAVSDKLAAARDQQEAFAQSQMGFFAAEPEPEQETPLQPDQRHTLGQAAEQKIAAMMSVVGKNFKPGEPTRLWQPSMSGKYINQQRAIKLLEKNRRLVLPQGVGSGKTVMMLGGFTHLHAQGKAKRGLFVVPSIVQGQFSGEALRYLEPGKYKWHIAPGASREERIAAYRDPDTHFSVVTHQAFRDDMLHLAAQQAGIGVDEMSGIVKDMDPEARKTWMRGVMDGAGMDHDFLAIDEGHDLLNRAGKEDSSLANVIDAVAHNTPNYINASADPVKNDPSELFDLLHKVDPARYSDAKAFMRRYGVDTPSAKAELRRELARYFYPGRIDPGVAAHRKVETVPLNADQQGALKDVEKHLARARLARMRGQVDVAALRAISPSSFDGVDPARHEDLARRLQGNLGILKETAYRQAINSRANGAKQDAVSRLAHERRGKPGVVFAHSLEAVNQVAERLRKEGHRAVVITGADSAQDKGRKKLMFNPEKGEAQADILVASDAGAVGLNAQRGQWLVQYDTPDTAKTHSQRNGRIHRLGQKNDVELIDLVADHPSERRARDRLLKKDELRGILTAPLEGLDDTGLASYVNRARMEREQGGLF